MKIVSKFYDPYLLYLPRNKPSKSITVWPGLFILLNDSICPKMVIKVYFNFFRFFKKILELFECRRGDSYMSANRNFIRFAHSGLDNIGLIRQVSINMNIVWLKLINEVHGCTDKWITLVPKIKPLRSIHTSDISPRWGVLTPRVYFTTLKVTLYFVYKHQKLFSLL